jgi:tetratricopeptide (TPR) repeat protein
MDLHPAASGGARRAYRFAFLAGLFVLAAALAGGLVRVASRDHALPGLAQDPLLEASRSSRIGEKDAARAEYVSAAMLNRGDDNMLFQAGVGLRGGGHHADAETALRQALAIRPRAATHAHLGWTLLERGRLDDAAASFEAALRLDPREAVALAGMGEVWLSRDRYPEAAAAFKRAIAAGAPTAGTLNSYGITLALGGEPAAAVAAFEAAARLSPTPDILANLERARAAARR